MSDVLSKINEASSRLLELQKERADREASANAHESQAREDRKAMTACKNEIAALSLVLRDAKVQQAVETAAGAVQKAQKDAEDTHKKAVDLMADLDAKQKEFDEKSKKLDELLTKASGAVKTE